MRVDYNPYEGTVVEGSPSVVISGNVIIDGDTFVGKKGAAASSARPEPSAIWVIAACPSQEARRSGEIPLKRFS
jgi:hypothetical protein